MRHRHRGPQHQPNLCPTAGTSRPGTGTTPSSDVRPAVTKTTPTSTRRSTSSGPVGPSSNTLHRVHQTHYPERTRSDGRGQRSRNDRTAVLPAAPAGPDFARDNPVAPQMVNFVYLIGDRETGEAVAVDPAYGVGELVELLDADGLRLTGVLATHWHPDHLGGDLMGYPIEGIRELVGRTDVDAPRARAGERGGVGEARRRGRRQRPRDRTRAATSSRSVRSRSGCCTRPATRRAASASSSTASSWPATRCSSTGAAVPTCPAATPTRCTRASRSASRPSPTTPSCTPGICTRPSRPPRWARRGSATTSSGSPRSSSGARSSADGPRRGGPATTRRSPRRSSRRCSRSCSTGTAGRRRPRPARPPRAGAAARHVRGRLARRRGRRVRRAPPRRRARRRDQAHVRAAGVARARGRPRRCWAPIEARARALGYERLILETGTRQPEAIGLYTVRRLRADRRVRRLPLVAAQPLLRQGRPAAVDVRSASKSTASWSGPRNASPVDDRRGRVGVEAQVGEPVEDQVEADAQLEARQVHAEALVLPGAEREVVLDRPVDVELVRRGRSGPRRGSPSR